jgi:hypothetical protein
LWPAVLVEELDALILHPAAVLSAAVLAVEAHLSRVALDHRLHNEERRPPFEERSTSPLQSKGRDFSTLDKHRPIGGAVSPGRTVSFDIARTVRGFLTPRND